MKLALFACVHGDARALADVLGHARRKGAEELYCLGDVVGTGLQPLASIKLLRKNGVQCVAGEWDEAVSGGKPLPAGACGIPMDPDGALREARDALDRDSLGWLRTLPASLRIVRGDRSIVLAHGNGGRGTLTGDVLATGHVHEAAIGRSSAGTLLMVGAVGGGAEASYVLLDDVTLGAEVHRVVVDVVESA